MLSILGSMVLVVAQHLHWQTLDFNFLYHNNRSLHNCKPNLYKCPCSDVFLRSHGLYPLLRGLGDRLHHRSSTGCHAHYYGRPGMPNYPRGGNLLWLH